MDEDPDWESLEDADLRITPNKDENRDKVWDEDEGEDEKKDKEKDEKQETVKEKDKQRDTQRIGDRLGAEQNTFGIEVEFATHNSPILSFTHVEPCSIRLTGTCDCEKGEHVEIWKFETDANMTLELVSPILLFPTNKSANEFKLALMQKLQETVKGRRVLLRDCATEIGEYLIGQSQAFKYSATRDCKKQRWEYSIVYAAFDALALELNKYNWDDSTQTLEAFEVLGWEPTDAEALKAYKKEKQKREPIATVSDRGTFEAHLGTVVVQQSQKHDGYPNSQLNTPMTLARYADYLVYVKEPRAWLRLVNMKGLLSERVRRNAIARNVGNTITHDGELKKRAGLTKRAWLNTWFWLVSFRQMTQLGLEAMQSKYQDQDSSPEWRTTVDDWKVTLLADTAQKKKTEKTQKRQQSQSRQQQKKGARLDDIIKPLNTHLTHLTHLTHPATVHDKREVERLLGDLLYLTVQKLVAGAFGELAEPAQLAYQFAVYGSVRATFKSPRSKAERESLAKDIPKVNFRKFHSSLKDLTPLWFKAGLVDVYRWAATVDVSNNTKLFTSLHTALETLVPDRVKLILDENLRFLVAYLKLSGEKPDAPIPGVDSFLVQYEEGRQELLKAIAAAASDGYVFNSVPMVPATPVNPFLERTKPIPVPLWEGRWDTLKPPIGDKFLVEHRNH